jgi:hypothetical protein
METTSLRRTLAEPPGVAVVIDVILERGIVVDDWTRVSVLGVPLVTCEARHVVASLDTYLRYAERIAPLT